MRTRSESFRFNLIMDEFHDTPVGAPGAEMQALFADLLAFLQGHPRFELTLAQCKVVVGQGDQSDPIVHEEVHRVLMEEFKLHYAGDDSDYLDGPICMHENFRE